jgi:hypothetical protein
MVKHKLAPPLTDQINPQYFWDVDWSNPEADASKRLIIERVVCLGSLHEIYLLLKHYGRRTVIEVICNLNYLDPKTLNFIAKFFNLPKNAFKCHKRKLLIPGLWNS